MVGLRKDYVRLSNGRESTRVICEHPGAVAVIGITADKKLVFIRQYRRAPDKIMYEICAGLINKGESRAAAAKRELEEETGYVSGKIKYLTSAYTSPGYSTEIIHYFLATKLKKTVQKTDEDEIITVLTAEYSLCLKMIKSGLIKDNKTIAGILLAGQYAKLS